MEKYYLAIDIGASSGRHILGHVENGKIVLQEVYRFPNGAAKKNGHLCWDFDAMFGHIVEGIAKCGEMGIHPVSLGIDTWGVDFVLLDENDEHIGDYVAYRDKRTKNADREIDEIIPFPELYRRTGIQNQFYNTIYQLWGLKKEHPEYLERAKRLLLTTEYFNFLLTGVKKSEYTNCTTTSLMKSGTMEWDRELMEMLGFPPDIFGRVFMPGTLVGGLKKEIRDRVGFDTNVVLAATHDTASAIMAVPAKDEDSVLLSSGTWSLLGVELDHSITSDKSRKSGFTNEGGYDHRNRFLRSIMGLWIVQSIRNELNGAGDKKYSFAELSGLAEKAESFKSEINVSDGRFAAPDSMISEIRGYCRETGQAVPETPGELMQCAYMSLAKCYAESVRDLEEITGKEFRCMNIVGGGSKDGYLNGLTARLTGLPVYAGPSEGTSLGNLIAQMIREGEFAGLSQARAAIRKSFEIKEYR